MEEVEGKEMKTLTLILLALLPGYDFSEEAGKVWPNGPVYNVKDFGVQSDPGDDYAATMKALIDAANQPTFLMASDDGTTDDVTIDVVYPTLHLCDICGMVVVEPEESDCYAFDVSNGTVSLTFGLPAAVEMTYKAHYWTCYSCQRKYQKDFRDALKKAADEFIAQAKAKERKSTVRDELRQLEAEVKRLNAKIEALKQQVK